MYILAYIIHIALLESSPRSLEKRQTLANTVDLKFSNKNLHRAVENASPLWALSEKKSRWLRISFDKFNTHLTSSLLNNMYIIKKWKTLDSIKSISSMRGKNYVKTWKMKIVWSIAMNRCHVNVMKSSNHRIWQLLNKFTCSDFKRCKG